jgi:hypothetical protein
MDDRYPTPAERFQRVLAKHAPPVAAAPPAPPPPTRRPRFVRPPKATPPESPILDEDRDPPTWEALFAWGLRLRLARRKGRSARVVTSEHRRRAKRAASLVAPLPGEGRHARRKAGELVLRAWSTLPVAERTRLAMVAAVRQLQRALSDYARHAVDSDDRTAVTLFSILMNHPDAESAITKLENRPKRRQGFVDQGLRKFIKDMTEDPDRRGFPGGVAAAKDVAAACGVDPVGPRRRA